MQQAHNTAYFCPLKEHKAMTFRSTWSFDEHMRTEHSNAFTATQLPVIRKTSRDAISPLFGSSASPMACPLCPYTIHEAKNDMIVKTESKAPDLAQALSNNIQAHIGRHLEEAALLSIPEVENVDEPSVQRASQTVVRSEHSKDDDLEPVVRGNWTNATTAQNLGDVEVPLTSEGIDWSFVAQEPTHKQSNQDALLEDDPILDPFVKRAMASFLSRATYGVISDISGNTRAAASNESFWDFLDNSEEFQAFAQGPTDCLLCYTTDKSTTTTRLFASETLAYLSSTSTQNVDTVTCFMYFFISGSREQTRVNLLTDVLVQLLEASKSMPPGLMRRIGPRHGPPSFHDVLESIEDILRRRSRTFIVLSNLESYEHSPEATSILTTLLGLQAVADVRLLKICRSASRFMDHPFFEKAPRLAVDPQSAIAHPTAQSGRTGQETGIGTNQFEREDYCIAWVCASVAQHTACRLMLDEVHQAPDMLKSDEIFYAFGRVGPHNVVVACPLKDSHEATSAPTMTGCLLTSFPNLRFGVLIGIGGGVPSSNERIRLGDVVVGSSPGSWGKYQATKGAR